jgi:8-oxo-dGTP pyrophosphatase MutT (NUDIX family)
VTPADERVEHVDQRGRVLAVVTRAQMRAQGLRHRSTYVVVRSSTGSVLVHRRSDWKDLWPGRWDLAFGGVCGVGELWPDAAARELAEEAGVRMPPGDLTDRGPVQYDSPSPDLGVHVVGRLFCIVHDGPFSFDDGEVVEVAWIEPGRLEAWAAEHDLCDDSRAVVLPRL